MMRAFFIFFLQFMFGLQYCHAQDLGISMGPKGTLRLTAESCEKLQKEHGALCTWKQTLEPDFLPSPSLAPACKPNADGTFSWTETQCIPEFTQSAAGKKLARNGPNCWGTTLSFHGLSQRPRFVWPEEMLYWLDSPVCRKLDAGEAMLPGDIINVFYPEHVFARSELDADAGDEFWKSLYPNRYTPLRTLPSNQSTDYDGFLHSVTYISANLAFGKDGPAASDSFYFHPLRMVYGRPRGQDENGTSTSNVECTENQTIAPYLREYQQPPSAERRSKCFYFSNAYRCGNILDQLSRQSTQAADVLRLKKIRLLQSMQSELFPLVLKISNRISREKETSLRLLAAKIASRDLIALQQKNLTKNTEMLLSLEYFSAAGILKTLKQSHEKPSQ